MITYHRLKITVVAHSEAEYNLIFIFFLNLQWYNRGRVAMQYIHSRRHSVT